MLRFALVYKENPEERILGVQIRTEIDCSAKTDFRYALMVRLEGTDVPKRPN
eukprot:COSAG03_NODE_2048_length_3185_cov_42.169151_5_plen_52_part_00